MTATREDLVNTTPWTPLPLSVSAAGDGQFIVKRTERRFPPDMAWDQYYVEFSGYFGHHGPHVFAAAPELADVIERLLLQIEQGIDPLGNPDRSAYTSARSLLDRVRAAK